MKSLDDAGRPSAPRRRMLRPAHVTASLTLSLLGASTAACGGVAPAALPPTAPVDRSAGPEIDLSGPAPGSFTGRTVSADVLVVSGAPLPDRVRNDLHGPAVKRTAPISYFSVEVDGRRLTVGAGDPGALRPFFARRLARDDEVWERLAAGEAIASRGMGNAAVTTGSSVILDSSQRLPAIDVAATAALPIQADLIVNQTWAAALRAPLDNAVLLSTSDPEAAVADLDAALEDSAQVIELNGPGATEVPRPAVLTGGAVAEAVGSFTYVPRADGTISIDPDWVAQNITTEDVPILGRATCHRVVLPQLRGALQELVDRGLARLIRADDFGGCFYPRFIAHDPTRGLSLHSWGIAFDINVSTNQRSTAGDMDPRVVAVMASWGFSWGGTWSDPDPMHFELGALRK